MSDRYLPYAADAEQSLAPDELLVLRRQYERELPQARVQTKFNYAWGLIKSTSKREQQKGVGLMHEIYNENAERKRECLYYLAIGYYKMGEYANARVHVEQLLALEPGNAQAQSLRELIDERVSRDGLIGLAVTGGAVALVGVVAAAIFSKRSK
ncbi:mitochondrial membrane protein [Coemansia sp. RSA 2706]|nr:mitochondrial membrane protein [Coemansia sp. RSA 2711]KAJ1850007.1 mitochondrial membrane protein [Coemansia sp. RSA 2708]KAJ2306410.1 mitochondrial membrane protein [Coemansia sp. RSA 2706]KAJ2313749.1 mitochondrial membrane protein [Coemansia sp. RSA 2705]KAJ2321855.1 mitochondrial membrane protein [Coemansia sp. RSA 2704]KAJ2328170.1 mitochondrial membrane protein [Coemansia sp. RSA 2702]KAJ2369788.1 mitochondrial membrane protein [Coemansia sp. RSA 2610]KAJ2391220.1 mitochondrial mem